MKEADPKAVFLRFFCAKVIHPGIFFLIARTSNLVQAVGNSRIFKYTGYFLASHTISEVDTPQVEMALACSRYH